MIVATPINQAIQLCARSAQTNAPIAVTTQPGNIDRESANNELTNPLRISSEALEFVAKMDSLDIARHVTTPRTNQ
jgi:hypothetical protein